MFFGAAGPSQHSENHWDLKNPFASSLRSTTRVPLSPPLRHPSAFRLSQSPAAGIGSALAFHLANALFQTACRFDELIQLNWGDCQRWGGNRRAAHQGQGSVFQDAPVPGPLSAALLEWKAIQEKFKDRRILAPGGIAFAASQFVFVGYSGRRFPTGRSICGCERGAERLGWGRSRRMDCATPRPRSSSTKWERICGKSRSCSATRISAQPCATPTSAMSRLGKPLRR